MLDKKLLAPVTLLLLGLIGVLHISAVIFFIYWEYWWFDIPMHFLGGMFAAFISAWVITMRRPQLPAESTTFIAGLFFSALLIGILWEIYEYIAGVTYVAMGSYFIDTTKDIVVDMAGAYTAYRMILRWFLKR